MDPLCKFFFSLYLHLLTSHIVSCRLVCVEWSVSRVDTSVCWHLRSRLNELLLRHHHLLLVGLRHINRRKHRSWLHHLTWLRLILGHAGLHLHHLHLLRRHLHHLHLLLGHLIHLHRLGFLRDHWSLLRCIFLFFYFRGRTHIVFLLLFALTFSKGFFSFLSLLLSSSFFKPSSMILTTAAADGATDWDKDDCWYADSYYNSYSVVWFWIFAISVGRAWV